MSDSATPQLVLGGGRYMRPLEESDADGLHALVERNRTELARWMQWALAERLGFHYEGTLRQSYRITDERYSDDAVYSLLASDARCSPNSASATAASARSQSSS